MLPLAQSWNVTNAARPLYDRLIAPLDLDLTAPLAIAPDSTLHLVPFIA